MTVGMMGWIACLTEEDSDWWELLFIYPTGDATPRGRAPVVLRGGTPHKES